MSTVYRGRRDPWKETALYEVWVEILKYARRIWRQSVRYKTGEDFPVDPIFREFYKFRLWAWFCHGYRAGESDSWHAVLVVNEVGGHRVHFPGAVGLSSAFAPTHNSTRQL